MDIDAVLMKVEQRLCALEKKAALGEPASVDERGPNFSAEIAELRARIEEFGANVVPGEATGELDAEAGE
jgi:hypothetical protein